MFSSLFTRSLRRWLSLDSTRQDKSRRRAVVRPGLETLEDRLVPTLFTTTAMNVADLKSAITQADKNPIGNQYVINLVKTGPYSFDGTNNNGVDNSYYGNNVLPPIAADITINGNGATMAIDPSKVSARFFFIANAGTAGAPALNPGFLTLENVTLSGGTARGGNSSTGGGGLGAGGAIFNNGNLDLNNVTFTANTAAGGFSGVGPTGARGGGGMGANADASGNGGGFGSAVPSGGFGGPAGGSNYNSDGEGAGGAGFTQPGVQSNQAYDPIPDIVRLIAEGIPTFGIAAVIDAVSAGLDPAGAAGPIGGSGGGNTGLGGHGGQSGTHTFGLGGDGGGGGAAADGPAGGALGGGFGVGGHGAANNGGGGGGGVGGGGGASGINTLGITGGAGGGGGFGGGGGAGTATGQALGSGGQGGFGGGGGMGAYPAAGTIFGGGVGSTTGGGGGAGLGGALFNLYGNVTITGNTFTNNRAVGGNVFNGGGGGGSRLGAALFNLDGNISVDSSTLSGNRVIGGSDSTHTVAPADGGAIYNLALGMGLGTTQPAHSFLTLTNSMLTGSLGSSGGPVNDVANDAFLVDASSAVLQGSNNMLQTGETNIQVVQTVPGQPSSNKTVNQPLVPLSFSPVPVNLSGYTTLAVPIPAGLYSSSLPVLTPTMVGLLAANTPLANQWFGLGTPGLPAGMTLVGNTLTVTGDQSPTSLNDQISINQVSTPMGAGGLQVTLNGQSVTFAPNAISGVTVSAATGTNTIQVLGVAGGVSVNLVDSWGGIDNVSIGANGSLQNIAGSVQVTGFSPVTNLSILDSADTAAYGNVTVSDTGVSGLTPSAISYQSGRLNSLTIYGGSGASTYNVVNTPNAPGGTALYSGAGASTVNVSGTTGALNVVVGQLGGVGVDPAVSTVNIGSDGSVQAINGTVYVGNFNGYTSLNVNDSADTVSHTAVSIGPGGVTGLAPAAITWSQYVLQALTISGGTGSNTYTVVNTPANNRGVTTTLNSGAGANTVNVQATIDPLTINGGGFGDAVNIGLNGSVQGIIGAVTVTNPPAYTNLKIDDSSDPWAQTINVSSTGITGMSAPIYYHQGDLQALTVLGGQGGDTFVVNSTPSNPYVVTRLIGGAGGMAVKMTTNPQGRLALQGGGGVNTLDYSAYTSDVRVNRILGTATGVSDGVSNFQHILGGQGNNLLVGYGANEELVGGSGHNLLIDGNGSIFMPFHSRNALLVGGTGDNLIVAEGLSYTSNQQALDALFAEWSRTDETAAQRMAHLRTGVGSTGSYALNSSTLFSASDSDTLVGGYGFNWVMVDASDTTVNPWAINQVN